MTNKFICRGISKYTGKFIYGYPCFFVYKNVWGIFEHGNCVKSKEITQEPDRWTGLKDKNDKPIYENDIVKINVRNYGSFEREKVIQIKYIEPRATWNIFYLGYNEYGNIEIIGNTHFNKELLEEEK